MTNEEYKEWKTKEEHFQKLFSKVCADPNTIQMKIYDIDVIVNTKMNFVGSFIQMSNEQFFRVRKYLVKEGFLV